MIGHGYGGIILYTDKAAVFEDLGYSVFLIDFMGSGGSKAIQPL